MRERILARLRRILGQLLEPFERYLTQGNLRGAYQMPFARKALAKKQG